MGRETSALEREKNRRLLEIGAIKEHELDRVPSMNLTNLEEYQLKQRYRRNDNFEDQEDDLDEDNYENSARLGSRSLTNRLVRK